VKPLKTGDFQGQHVYLSEGIASKNVLCPAPIGPIAGSPRRKTLSGALGSEPLRLPVSPPWSANMVSPQKFNGFQWI
jgi:hypothetical protein